MKTISAIISTMSAIVLVSGFSGIAFANAQDVRNTAEYNLDNGVGLKGFQEKAAFGFDPVSIFSEGGGVPLEGQQALNLDYQGVKYFFANSQNREAFIRNPNKYEPTYGGWCAYAMASGQKIHVEAKYFSIHGNRAHYFVSNRAKQNFDRDVAGHEGRADGFWKQISGEDPRL